MADMTAAAAAALIDDLAERIDAGALWDDGQLLELGNAALTMVLLRTKQGLDVDRKPFAPYQPAYAKERAGAGLQATPVDLARTGHMLGSLTAKIVDTGSVTVAPFLSEHEGMKLAAHNVGVNKTVTVKGSGGYMAPTYVNAKTGQFATRKQIAKGKGKGKGKGLTVYFTERPDHARQQRLPKRELMDIRHPDEVAALGEMVGAGAAFTVDKVLRSGT